MFGKYVVWADSYQIILPSHTKNGTLVRRNDMGIRVIRYRSKATRYVTLPYSRGIPVSGSLPHPLYRQPLEKAPRSELALDGYLRVIIRDIIPRMRW